MTWLVLGCAGAPTARLRTDSATDLDAPRETGGSGDVADDAWLQRLQVVEAERAIQLWTQRIEQHPDDTQTWLRLAQAHHFVATVHARDAASTIRHAQAGLDAVAHATDHEAPPATAQVPALYWRARNLAVLASARGYADMLITDAEVGQLLSVCEQRQPEYDHSGALVLLAQRMAAPVDVSRRDLPRARALFTRALAADPNHLPNRVALAEHYAVVAQDRALFEHELLYAREAVLPADADAELHVAQARARQLLARINELFE